MTVEVVRAFVALPISEVTRTRLARVQQDLQGACPVGVRWTRASGIHLTLFFLGDVPTSRLEPIETALAVVARNASPLVLQVQGLGCFPNLQRPRVVWVGLEERTGRLALTHQAVNEALAQVGFEPETRPFKPHLTLGRVQRGASRDVAAQLGQAVARRAERGLTLGEETVTDLVLFRSVLKPTGAEYSRLATFTLGQ